ncbi:MAG: hypothetical protein J0I15_13135 [Herbaspirillum huttiense]|uniref:HNH endonuclease n=1 Tax=Herbaspirillum huttiense TaxID=863372 RepID=UPI001AC21BA0|nr:HNH endonuclease [Herbaspirillum huttiense]MBN9357392.1 hypothetical protein [Herbaspirillum huttiense]
MSRCIFCHEEKTALTDEHIIPAALSSNVVLKKSSCTECQKQCNSSFETRFLKGSNFIALIRAQLGLKGRRNEPVYGFDSHGSILTLPVQPGFPEIRVGLSSTGIYRPPQIICLDEQKNPLSFSFFPETPPPALTIEFIAELVGEIPEGTTTAALWVDGDLCTANGWRLMLEAFVAWANRKQIIAIASSVSTENARVNFRLDWSAAYRDQGIAKICYVFLMSLLDESSRHGEHFKDICTFILTGARDHNRWPTSRVIQWQGEHPLHFSPDTAFTILLAVVANNGKLFGFVHLFNMGLFAVELGETTEEFPLVDTLRTYLFDKNKPDAPGYIVTEHSAEVARKFGDEARRSSQLV